jgi:hypothetical protein
MYMVSTVLVGEEDRAPVIPVVERKTADAIFDLLVEDAKVWHKTPVLSGRFSPSAVIEVKLANDYYEGGALRFARIGREGVLS